MSPQSNFCYNYKSRSKDHKLHSRKNKKNLKFGYKLIRSREENNYKILLLNIHVHKEMNSNFLISTSHWINHRFLFKYFKFNHLFQFFNNHIKRMYQFIKHNIKSRPLKYNQPKQTIFIKQHIWMFKFNFFFNHLLKPTKMQNTRKPRRSIFLIYRFR